MEPENDTTAEAERQEAVQQVWDEIFASAKMTYSDGTLFDGRTRADRTGQPGSEDQVPDSEGENL